MSNYTVQKNDNLWRIVRKEYGLKDVREIANMVNKLAKANNMSSPNTIFSGKNIKLVEYKGKAPVGNGADVAKDGKAAVGADAKVSSFSNWTNNVLAKSAIYNEETGEFKGFKSGTKDFEITDKKGSEAMSKLNDLIAKGDKADKKEFADADKQASGVYTQSVLNVAKKDIKEYYDKNNDGMISEEEFVNSEIKQHDDTFPEDKLAGEILDLSKAQAKERFKLLNMDNRDGKNLVDASEYGAYIAAMDANNSTGLADGKLTKEEYMDSSMLMENPSDNKFKVFNFKMSLMQMMFSNGSANVTEDKNEKADTTKKKS